MVKSFKKKSAFAAFIFVALATLVPQVIWAAAPQNIIFFIGDGMASTQRRTAEEVHKRKLAMNTLPVVGIYTTYSENSIVPDSAATGTAMASGYKTESGIIGMNTDADTAYETIAEAAKRLGKSVGLVTTTRITHATPAAFGAHTDDRDDENLIAVQYLKTNFEVLLGGGWRHFVPKSTKKSRRWEERDVLSEFSQKGYQILRNKNDLTSLEIQKDTKVLGVFHHSHLPFYLDRKNDVPGLVEMTQIAIKILSQNPKGFFLMVEGGRIDHASHGNSPAASIGDLLELDNAVQVAIDYGKKDPATLILAGGDHETGGMGMGIGGDYFMRPEVIKKVTMSEYGMGYGGTLLNDPDQAIALFKKHTGIAKLTAQETKALKLAIKHAKDGSGMRSPNGFYNPSWFGYTFANILSRRAHIGWTSYAHTGHPVMITAGGPGSEKFMGFYDNTDICKKMSALWGVTLKTWEVEEEE